MIEKVLDASGAYGGYFHYASVIFLFGSALLVFIYCWYSNRLDMDEEPSHQMMRINEEKDYEQ